MGLPKAETSGCAGGLRALLGECQAATGAANAAPWSWVFAGHPSAAPCACAMDSLVLASEGQGASGEDQLRLEVTSQDSEEHHSAAAVANRKMSSWPGLCWC